MRSVLTRQNWKKTHQIRGSSTMTVLTVESKLLKGATQYYSSYLFVHDVVARAVSALIGLHAW